MTGKERCLRAIAGEPVDRIPVVPLLMFFAVDRAKITYRRFATDAAALVDAQLNMRRFKVDALTACSDAFRLSADLGGDMEYPETAPPRLMRPLVRNEADLKRLKRPDPAAKGSRMADRVAGVRGIARAAGEECLVLGWVEMPFAEACAICGGQLGQVGEQLADVGDLVGRARLGDLALVLLVLDRIAHEGDQGFVGKGIDKTQPLVLHAQRVVDGELVGQGLEGGLEVRPGLFAPRDLVGGETLDVVVLAIGGKPGGLNAGFDHIGQLFMGAQVGLEK